MIRKLWYLLNRRRLERELEEEMQFHAEQAGQQFGDITRWRERSRDEWGWRGVDETLHDIRYALRGLRRQPGYAVAAFLLLTLGVTANTAVFSVVRSVILSSLPVRDAASLAQLGYHDPAENEFRPNHTHVAFEMFSKEARTVRDLLGFSQPLEGHAIVNGVAGLMHAQAVTGNAFQVLGIGGALEPDKVVVSHGYAQRRGLVPGSVITINAVPFTVSEVLPQRFLGFAVGENVDIYFHADRVNEVLKRQMRNPGNMWLRIMGRLQPGATIESVRAELTPVAKRAMDDLYAALPPAMLPQVRKIIGAFRFEVLAAANGAQSEWRDSAQTPLLVLLGSSALLLLIACANLAGLALARSFARQREFVIRIALGCGRGRLTRQLLTESLLLAVAAGGCALLLSPVASEIVQSMVLDIELAPADSRVVLFTIVLTFVTGVLIGIVPAYRAFASARLVETREARSPRMSRVLVATQVALSLVLVTGATMFAQTFRSYRNIDPGYRRELLVSAGVNPGTLGYNNEQLLAYYRAGLERLRTIPGVTAATISRVAMGELNWTTIAEAHGVRERTGRNLAGPQFAQTMGLDLKAGRDLTDQDVRRPTALINESFAKLYGAGVGDRLRFMDVPNRNFEIIGVVKDARDRGPKHSVRPVAYSSWETDGWTWLTYNVRARRDVAGDLRRVLQSVDARVPIGEIRTAQQITDQQLRREQMMAAFGLVFGGLSLAVAIVGLYALLAYAVVRRTREIGVRLAVGATRTSVLGLILRHSAALIAAGVVIGIPVAAAASWAVRSQLHGVEPADPLVLGGVAVLISLAATAASMAPALRAMRIDPVHALRHE